MPSGREGWRAYGSTNRLVPARGGRAVGVAPGRLAAAGGNRGMRGGEASPHPSTAHVQLKNRGYAVAFRQGGVERRRPSTRRLVPARGERAVGVRQAAWPPRTGQGVGGGGLASPHPSTAPSS